MGEDSRPVWETAWVDVEFDAGKEDGSERVTRKEWVPLTELESRR